MKYIVACLTRPLAQLSFRVLTHVNREVELSRSYIHRKFNPNDPSKFASVEKTIVDSYVIASKSFNDYMHKIQPSKRRLNIAWSIVALTWAFVFEMSVLAYRNDPALLATLGFPLAFIQNINIIMLDLSLIASCSAFSRMFVLILLLDLSIRALMIRAFCLKEHKFC
jgi:hypothetical protein